MLDKWIFICYNNKVAERDTQKQQNPKTSGCSSVWLERYLGVVEAVGSSPVTPTNRNNLSNGCNMPIERLFLYPNIRFGQIMVKSGVTAVFFVDVKHINYLVRCPCLDLVECVSVDIKRGCGCRMTEYLRYRLCIGPLCNHCGSYKVAH